MEWGDCVKDGVPSLTCIPTVFSNVVRAALVFAGATAGFLIVFAGIKFVTSGGDPKQVASARQLLTYAIIGLVVVLSSFAIIFFISYVTKTDCIQNMDFTSCK
jgi:biotin transporter BioY